MIEHLAIDFFPVSEVVFAGTRYNCVREESS